MSRDLLPSSNPAGSPRGPNTLVFFAAALGLSFALQAAVARQTQPREVPYSELMEALRQGRVAEVELGSEAVVARLQAREGSPAESIRASRLPGLEERALLDELEARAVPFSGRIERTSWVQMFVLTWVLPLALLAGVWFLVMRHLGRRGGPLSVGRNKAKIYDEGQQSKVTFEDVAGVDESKQELSEVVRFLRDPSRFAALGARVPKGVLLVGPPGTGKTLLARAVAGEAGVPFFSLSGSEFVEMFVGVGAARVRDLFEQAKKRAPCIVFIDELDAVGRSRGGNGGFSTHDEREQTLNQLLVEMDGFDAATGVILVAATNRPEVLDAALLRAGRFDRQVLVDRPDLAGREAILRVHVKKVALGPGVNLQVIARRTPGMVGADLANVVNEAALAAVRRDSSRVLQQDFEEAIDRLQLGLEKSGRLIDEDDRRRVAFHEGGHTLVALSVENADPVHRVTIIPRSIGALGVTLQLPANDSYIVTRDRLLDRICVMMGGRAAEEVVFGDRSTGASNDLERASETARQMVCRFGMADALGAVSYGRAAGARFLTSSLGPGDERNYSEETARAIDAEVRAILDSQYARAVAILRARRGLLGALADRLLEKETLERAELLELARGEIATSAA